MKKLKGGEIYLKKSKNALESPVQQKQKLFARVGLLILKDRSSNILGFNPRDQQPCFSTKTTENVCITIEFNSRRIKGRDTNMAAVSLFGDTNIAIQNTPRTRHHF